jgi:hypothetical protein
LFPLPAVLCLKKRQKSKVLVEKLLPKSGKPLCQE